jgi:hypothetical protein
MIPFPAVPAWLRVPAAAGALLLATALPLLADTTNAPAVVPPVSNSDFGQYLADHQDDLAPFFTQNSQVLVQELVPVLLGLLGHVFLIAFLVGWLINIMLARGFTSFFAPLYAKPRHAIIYSTGELILGLVCAALLIFVVVTFPVMVRSESHLILLALSFLLAPYAVHVVWVSYAFRTSLSLSASFYLGVLLVHALTIFMIVAPLLGGQAPSVLIAYVDHSIVPRLQAEAEATRHEALAAQAQRDETSSALTSAQAQLAQAETDEQTLQKQIEDRKNSEAFLLTRIAQVRAQGDLNAARTQLGNLVTRFPNGPLTETVRAQLTDLDNEIATRDAKKTEADADSARLADLARTDLLHRASRGEVTLSEMRRVLVGKPLSEVKAMFGLPSAIASDRWGFAQQMIYNPLNERKSGLAIYFSDNIVQGVDYFNVTPPSQ